ncbi:arsenic resistance N-acetyltransferase ArsN2 [Halegenticoccus tardaugens]|uniref:arsenic resistance N-acetyltransferase ArsN2 n=1 Tax=Halegenticoccus tardaugens TaxID=2071624 RepID=UPI00100B141B|nr:arsenic resistance N-acetyltransferase ArsN2 [Halegenticoccus tardaugens]
MGATMTVRRATGSDLEAAVSLLERNDLPTDDARDAGVELFVGTAGPERRVVAVGGLERYGSDALLRSVAVDQRRRGSGYGREMCEVLREYARSRDVETLFHLATTATDFFERLGFERIERDAAPEPIRSTAQFASLCPASATCMRARIGSGSVDSGAPTDFG